LDTTGRLVWLERDEVSKAVRSMNAIFCRRAKAAACGTVRAASVVIALASCGGKDPYSPGTQLGTFHVAAKLTRTTCGKTPDPWEFDVRLNHEGTMLYWIQGGAPVEGKVDATAKTELHVATVHDLRPADAKRKLAACAVARADVVTMTLNGADAKPTRDPSLTTSFTGGLAYTFKPTDGSDCEDQLTSMGGGFEALPCDVHYDLVGTFKAAPR
jgi:hypothetical protein